MKKLSNLKVGEAMKITAEDISGIEVAAGKKKLEQYHQEAIGATRKILKNISDNQKKLQRISRKVDEAVKSDEDARLKEVDKELEKIAEELVD